MKFGKRGQSSPSPSRPKTSVLQRCVSALLITLVVASIGSVLLGFRVSRRAASAPTNAVLIVAPSLIVAEDLNTFQEAMAGRLVVRTYAEPNMTDLVKSLPGGQAYAKKQRTLLITPDAKGGSSVTSDPSRIQNTLSGMVDAVRTSQFPAIPVAFVVGVFIGSLILPSNLAMLVVTCLALLAAVYKSTHACSVCPVDRLLGMPIELWAVAAYFSATVALIVRPTDRMVVGLVSAGAGAIFGVQLYLFANSRELCIPCGIIALSNGALIMTGLARLGVTELRFAKLYARLAVPLIGVAIISAAQAIERRAIVVAGTTASRGQPISLRGKPLSTIKLSAGPGREVVVLVSDTCHACNDAKAWVATHPSTPVRIVRLLMGGQKPTSTNELSFQSQVKGVPDLLFVDNGNVVSELGGWSNDPLWELSTWQQVQSFLAKKGKP